MANLKKNLVYNFLLSLSQVLVPLVSIPYVARILDPDGIGRVSFIDSFSYYLLVIAELGLGVYGTRVIARVRQDRGQVSTAVSELLVLHICATACVILVYVVALVIGWQQLHDWRLVCFSLSFLITQAFACEWYFRGMEAFRYITLRSLCTRLLGLLSIFVLVKQPADYYLYYGIMAGSAILNALVNFYQLTRLVPIRFRQVNWRQHIARTRFIYYISLTYGITLLLDNVLLRLVSTAAAVGWYAFSARIVRLSTALITDSLLVFFPRIAAMQASDDAGMAARITQRNLALLVFLAVPLSVGTFLLADEIVLVLFGEKFYPAIVDVKLLALFPCIKAFNLFLGNQVLMANNLERAYLGNLLVSGSLFIVLTLLLSYYWADRGACVALLIAEAVTGLLNLRAVKRLLPQSLDRLEYRSIGQAVLVSMLFVPLLYGIRQLPLTALPQLALGIGASLVVYGAVQYFVVKGEVALSIRQWMTAGVAGNRFPDKAKEMTK